MKKSYISYSDIKKIDKIFKHLHSFYEIVGDDIAYRIIDKLSGKVVNTTKELLKEDKGLIVEGNTVYHAPKLVLHLGEGITHTLTYNTNLDMEDDFNEIIEDTNKKFNLL